MRNWLAELGAAGAVLSGEGIRWEHEDWMRRVERTAQLLRSAFRPHAAIAILADNSPHWIVADLAAHLAGVTLVPLPAFFTPAQWQHALDAAAVEGLFCVHPGPAALLGFGRAIDGADDGLALFARQATARPAAQDIQKITFTSGTTAQPKGVCLSSAQQWELAGALSGLLAGLEVRRHLNLLPLAVLLENIAGAYTALLSGATDICLPLARTGLSGAAQFDPLLCLDSIAAERAESVILLPQMLQALVGAARPADSRLHTLKFIAVGGAKSPAALIAAARAKGFPVYEGYGLSECASVVALNLPGHERVGSVGRPLPGRRVRIAADGEIEVAGGTMAGYLGGPAVDAGEWLTTGDLGHVDADGYLHIDGRKDNLLVTGYGRNVSPEWPEAALLGTGAVAQALVAGAARPWLSAAIVPVQPGVPDSVLDAAVAQANRELPDYARIRRWVRTDPFGEADGTATANGRLRRAAALARCRAAFESLYENDDIDANRS